MPLDGMSLYLEDYNISLKNENQPSAISFSFLRKVLSRLLLPLNMLMNYSFDFLILPINLCSLDLYPDPRSPGS